MYALLGADSAQRQALAAQFVQRWQQEAEHLVAQRHSQKATQVSVRMLVVNPSHAQALQGRAQVYRQAGMEQAAELDERTLQGLSSPIGRQE
jgi:regulator of sirC expression with transglutaminase-like and TPR domain